MSQLLATADAEAHSTSTPSTPLSEHTVSQEVAYEQGLKIGPQALSKGRGLASGQLGG